MLWTAYDLQQREILSEVVTAQRAHELCVFVLQIANLRRLPAIDRHQRDDVHRFLHRLKSH